MPSYRVPVAPLNISQDFDTLAAFPDFIVEVTVLPKEMQLHRGYGDPEDAVDFFFPAPLEEFDMDEEEEECLTD